MRQTVKNGALNSLGQLAANLSHQVLTLLRLDLVPLEQRLAFDGLSDHEELVHENLPHVLAGELIVPERAGLKADKPVDVLVPHLVLDELQVIHKLLQPLLVKIKVFFSWVRQERRHLHDSEITLHPTFNVLDGVVGNRRASVHLLQYLVLLDDLVRQDRLKLLPSLGVERVSAVVRRLEHRAAEFGVRRVLKTLDCRVGF